MNLKDAPIGTKAPSVGGGHWCKVKKGWKWNGPSGSGGIFPIPGGDWNQKLVLPCPPCNGNCNQGRSCGLF